MENINDLQIGKVGEYLVCADLILKGYIAFPSEQGLPFDIVADINGRLFKVQVKTTRGPKNIPQRKTVIPAYRFSIGRNGKKGRHKKYEIGAVDIFALVALDTKRIGYLSHNNTQSTMNFRVPELRGQYHDEQAEIIKQKVIKMKNNGLSGKQIAAQLSMKLTNVQKYSANISIEQKGSNAGTYFDALSLERCLNDLRP